MILEWNPFPPRVALAHAGAMTSTKKLAASGMESGPVGSIESAN